MHDMNNDIAKVLISEEQLQAKVAELGAQISRDYEGKDLLLVSILKGSVVFMADLMRAITEPCSIDFMVVSSYGGANTTSTGLVKIVKDLVESGHAYVAHNGDVYFRVKSDPGYGKLSHLNLDDLESGNRELRSQMDDDLKEDPADFAVWKAAKPGEPSWNSPWGQGRPGWHIECSAMARKHLGKTIDLHAGGQDLIFPHHENEIAQSECANGCTFSHYWMHNGFLNINNQKMSKSANNFFTVREIADKYGYEPIRYFMLTAGYRMPLNYTVDLIESCKNSLERLYTCRDNLDFAIRNAHGTDTALTEKCEEARKKFKTAMDDDLNTPDALAAIFEFVKDINTMSAAKKAKDFARADALRAKITELGWNVMDTAKGPQLTKL